MKKILIAIALMFCATEAKSHPYHQSYYGYCPNRVYIYYNPYVTYNSTYNRDRDRYVEPLVIENPFCKPLK